MGFPGGQPAAERAGGSGAGSSETRQDRRRGDRRHAHRGEPVSGPDVYPFPHVSPLIAGKHVHLSKSEDWEERTNPVTVRQ